MRARNIYADFVVTAKGFVRSGIGLFFSLIFPIILIALFGLILGGASHPPTLFVLNEDHNSPWSQKYLANLNRTGAVSVDLVGPQSPSDFAQMLRQQQASIGLVIPAGFEADYLNHTRVNLTLYVNPSDAASTGAALGALDATNNLFNLQAVNGAPILGQNISQIGGVQYHAIDYLVPGLIGFSILTSPMFAMVDITSSYRKEGLFRQLSLTPLTRSEWLTSKILWYTVITFASAAIMIGTGYGLFGAQVALSWAILPFLFIGPFLFVSLGMLAGSVAKTPESAAIIGNIITFPMMFLSGTFFPVSQFPPGLQTFAHVLPLYYVIDGLEGTMLYANIDRALLDLAVVAVLAIGIFAAAVVAFKWREE